VQLQSCPCSVQGLSLGLGPRMPQSIEMTRQ
jgi:hypothetical protein